MKKILLIIGGSILIVLLVSIWVYVMFFGTPTTVEEFFGGFGGNDSIDESVAIAPPVATSTTEQPYVAINSAPLRQLTTKPVAGFREVQTAASSTPEIYYAEAGTGHIYSINLSTGVERRLSGTTIAEARQADFTDDGRYVAILSGYGGNQKFYIGSLSTSTDALTQIPFSNRVDDFTITPDNTLLYSTRDQVTSGGAYTLTTNKEQTLFTLPFREAAISWGSSAIGPHYVYPKPAHLLEGFLYKIENGKLSRLPATGYGLTAFGSDTLVGVSKYTNQTFTSYFLTNNQEAPASIRLLPEKCTTSRSSSQKIWCAADTRVVDYGFPDTWYAGDIAFRDSLYALEVTPEYNSITVLSNTFTETNRDIDVIDLSIGKSEQRLYFINKNDSTLWTYAFNN